MATAILLAGMVIADALEREKPGAMTSIFKGLFGLIALSFAVFYDYRILFD